MLGPEHLLLKLPATLKEDQRERKNYVNSAKEVTDVTRQLFHRPIPTGLCPREAPSDP
jgi:hypothetical protein